MDGAGENGMEQVRVPAVVDIQVAGPAPRPNEEQPPAAPQPADGNVQRMEEIAVAPDQDGRRRSKRTAGDAPSHSGIPSRYVSSRKKKDKTPKVVPVQVPPPESVLSGKPHSSLMSRGSKQSQVQAAKLGYIADQAISTIEMENLELKRQIQLMELDARKLRNELSVRHKKLKTIGISEDEKKIIQEEIDQKLAEVNALDEDIRRENINLDFKKREAMFKIRGIQQEAQIKLLELEEYSSKVLDINPINKRKMVENWANNVKTAAELSEKEDSISLSSEEREEMENDSEPQRLKTPENHSVLESVTKALADALKTIIPSQPSRSTPDRFLARQVQGRELPTFSGRPEEWPSFRAAFINSTRNCQYTNADNLSRLQRCLKGEAHKTVQSLLINPEGVPHAMEMLEMRFGRPALIIETLIKQVRDIPSVKMDKPEMFVNYGIAVSNLVSMIKTLNKQEYLANPTLLQELTAKLPLTHQMNWMCVALENPSLEDFGEWMKKLTIAACKLTTPTIPDSNDKRRDSRSRNERAMVANENKTQESSSKKSSSFGSKSKCSICSKDDHKGVNCPTFKKMSVDERWKTAKEKKICYGCLNRGHTFRDCRSKRKCGVDECEKLHCSLLHQDKGVKPESKDSVNMTHEDEPLSDLSNENCKSAHSGRRINYLVVPAIARTENRKRVKIFLAFDSYSSLTATSDATMKSLGIKGVRKPLTVEGFQSTTTVQDSYSIDIEVESRYSNFSTILKGVRTVPHLSLPSQSLPAEALHKYKHLRELNLEPFDEATPTILVGMDNFQLHFPQQKKTGKYGEPIAIRTVFGWAVVGRLGESQGPHNSFKMMETVEDPLHQLVKNYFTTESVGVQPTKKGERCAQDIKAQAIMDRTVKRVNGGWECGLLWKEPDVNLPKSREYAYKRLLSMERKMDKNPDFAKQYQERINEFEEKGFSEKLNKEEASKDTSRTFYIPHFLAYNAKKPNKYRFVFDAAAKVQGKSLNDHLYQGPDKMVSLVGLLLQFRRKKIAITADIKDFFPHVKVRKEDCDAQRFLWRGLDRNREPDVWRMNVLIFGAACSPACAQEAKDKNAEEFKNQFPSAHKAIVERHYVDDYLDCCDNVEEAIVLTREVVEVQKRGSFTLCNWLSNSTEVIAAIPEDSRSKSLKGFTGKEDLVERILGLFWRPEEDSFTFCLKFLKLSEDMIKGIIIPTKRQVLSLVMSLFDPLGFLSILTVKAKMILQETWRAKIGWDDRIPEHSLRKWNMWLSELQKIQSFKMKRCYSSNFSCADEIQLHIFCDAGEEAFGTVAFFRIVKDGEVESSLVMSKSNVSPLKPLSIPRLELQAAVMGARLQNFILENVDMKISRVILWTDSLDVIAWIRADGRRFQQFVATRIGEIQTLTNIIQWRWVPTADNVADDITRFAKPCDWSEESRWLNGPPFLKLPEEDWPVLKEKSKEITEPLEMKKEVVFIAHQSLEIIDSSRFSSWSRMVRAMAYVLRFVSKLKKIPATASYLSTEVSRAKDFLLKLSQKQSFAEEIYAIENKAPLPKKSKLWKFSPGLENGLLVVKGRLEFAKCLKQETKHPIILDSKHSIVKLLISYYHNQCGHHGQERIANELRQKYCVLGLRVAVRSAQSRCQICRNQRAKPTSPEMGQLPSFRLEGQVRPFVRTGLDYFGPVHVIVKRSQEKRYVALFTCLSTRAIHLEIAGNLSTDSCIMSMRRFFSRRGQPQTINSDNGTNFVGANTELKEALEELNQTKIQEFCSNRGITWRFNPPSAPHMGGSWERMVRSVKTALGDTMTIKTLREEVLHTLLLEAEHTVNSHPLTHVPDDPTDEEALTPNHFLIGRSSNLQPVGEFSSSDLYGRKNWRMTQHLADHFWKRWVKEYLPTLLRREKWCRTEKPVKEGDVVLEVNTNYPRNTWPKGRVIKVYPGKDGVVRVVDIKLGNGHIYRRPVVKLCVLDIEPRQEEDTATAPLDEMNADINMGGGMSPLK